MVVRTTLVSLALLWISAICVSVATADGRADSPPDVLRSLQDLRQRTLKAAPMSGRGIAELEGEIIEPGRPPGPMAKHAPGGESRRIAKHRVEFTFIGRDTIRKEFHPTRDTLVAESYLVQDGSETCYWSGDTGPAPRSVIIRPVVKFAYSGEIEWSYSELASIPSLQETNLDGATLPSRGAEVEIKGSIVILKRARSPEEARKVGVLSESWSREFDRAHGGMLTRYIHHVRTRDASKRETEIREEYTTRWTLQDGIPVPAERTTEVRYAVNGQPTQSRRFRALFTEFTLGSVDAGELSIENLGIPSGTPVNDLTTQTGWIHGNEAATLEKHAPGPAGRGKTATLPTR